MSSAVKGDERPTEFPSGNKRSSMCSHFVRQQSIHVGEMPYKHLHHEKVSLRSSELLKQPHQPTLQQISAGNEALLVLVLRE